MCKVLGISRAAYYRHLNRQPSKWEREDKILDEMIYKEYTDSKGRYGAVKILRQLRHVVASQAFSYVNNTLYSLLQQWAKHRHPNKNKWWRLNKYWHEKNGKRWLFTTDEYSLINLRRIKVVRHPKLQTSKNPFLHKIYFAKRKLQLKLLAAAWKGEEMLEPYERETLTHGS